MGSTRMQRVCHQPGCAAGTLVTCMDIVMPWWTTLVLLALGTYLWFSGRTNPDDVIGLLEQMLAVALGLVVLFVGHNLWLEAVVLLIALRLPAARRNHPVVERSKAGQDVLIRF